jgi:hypothetical protein
MGGFGIGRRWSCETKGRTGEHPALDVRQLQRGGLLRPGRSFTYRWYLDGKLAASINVTAEQDRVILSYEYGNPDESWQRDQYPVLLEWLQCNYGGGRAWFLCPGDGCGRRVAIIYGKIIFACRHCHSLAYVSQRKPAWRRGLNWHSPSASGWAELQICTTPSPASPKECTGGRTWSFAVSMTTRTRIHGLAGFDGGRGPLTSRAESAGGRASRVPPTPLARHLH